MSVSLFSWYEQVALGKTAKENERHVLMVSTGELKGIILGTLIKNKCDQIQLDLVFEKEFELSHTGSGSICYSGYGTQASTEEYPHNADYASCLLRHVNFFRGIPSTPTCSPLAAGYSISVPSNSVVVSKKIRGLIFSFAVLCMDCIP